MKIADLLTRLADAEIDFVIVGGLAMQMHGYGRQTYDVDIALAMDDRNLEKFVSLASELELRPVIPEKLESLKDAKQLDTWHKDKGMVAFALRGSGDLILDILIRPVVEFTKLRANAVRKSLLGRSFRVAGLDDLLLMKQAAARPKDQIDIIALEKLKRGENPNE
jgi:hypothetical protein